MESLTFCGRLTLEDVLDMQRYRSLAALRRPFRLLIGLIAIPVAFLAVYDLYNRGLVARNSYGLTPLAFLGLSLFALGGWSFMLRSAARNYYLKHPERYLETVVVLDDAGVSFRNADVETRLAWSVIERVIDTPKGLYFFGPLSQSLLWLPLRAFEGPNSKSTVVSLLNQRAVRVTPAA